MKLFLLVACLAAVFAITACSREPAPAAPAAPAAAAAPPPAKLRNSEWANKSFEEFEASVGKVGDLYVVNGDIPIADEKELREFFEQIRGQGREEQEGRLLRYASKGLWSTAAKKNLTYCVSRKFGDRHARVVQDMRDAAQAWQKAADVAFIHAPAHDGNCTDKNDKVVFNVAPNKDNELPYYALAFFPHQPRKERNLFIWDRTFELEPDELPQLVGVLRHELGHVLGFRHEHIRRPEAGGCIEPELDDVAPDTPYDRSSVMHYPDCGGTGDLRFLLSATDESGSACNYGAAPGFTINTQLVSRCITPVPPPANPGALLTKPFLGESVALREKKLYGPFAALPGTSIVVELKPAAGATGDADLYVRLAQDPTEEADKFDCRPFRTGSTESCELSARDSPRNEAHVMVLGRTAARYDLTVSYHAAR